jgi:uncharacterized protein YkwD
MKYPTCSAAQKVTERRASRGHCEEAGAAIGVPAILLCLLAATILVLTYLSPGLGAQSKPQRERSNSQAAEKRIKAMEEAVLLFTNKERSRAGLPAFEPSVALNYLARGQSRNMCGIQGLQHESDSFPRGWKRFRDRLKIVGLQSGGENVAYLSSSPEVEKWAKQVVNGWMKSPPHKKNILAARFSYLGVGIAVCKDDLAYATQVFSPDAGRLP